MAKLHSKRRGLSANTCKEIADLMTDYLADKLRPNVRQEFAKHLSICPDCISFVNTFKKTVQSTTTLRAEEIPPKVRANMDGRTLSMDDTLKALKLPVLVTQGAADKLILVAAAKHTAATIPGAKLSIYDGVGHAPFWEDAARFNAELSVFVREANKTN